jgi:hypothetical protein
LELARVSFLRAIADLDSAEPPPTDGRSRPSGFLEAAVRQMEQARQRALAGGDSVLAAYATVIEVDHGLTLAEARDDRAMAAAMQPKLESAAAVFDESAFPARRAEVLVQRARALRLSSTGAIESGRATAASSDSSSLRRSRTEEALMDAARLIRAEDHARLWRILEEERAHLAER